MSDLTFRADRALEVTRAIDPSYVGWRVTSITLFEVSPCRFITEGVRGASGNERVRGPLLVVAVISKTADEPVTWLTRLITAAMALKKTDGQLVGGSMVYI